ncbi:MAG TPA: LpqB family beta-propeller domain-containing protein [Candidatus Acidoferrum sp.]|nr:LpqB family beta-propeller domain-containing protein [Candidatus Acidoferrum sp.]
MPIAPGTRLGPYEVLAPLGAGGMGEVYRARDSRLARDVALKVLPPDFATDPDRRARFEREARAAGQIHHPNVLTILDIGTHDALPFIVTELLEGETLRERLRPGPLPQRKAIEVASQIAKGLGAAQERGIVHRDIKPDNIFISRNGHVKILDFGLASVSIQESAPSDATISLKTASGIILGTAAYMSPEQARGQTVDSRSDIFSLGSVLYEMLSGERPFKGNSYADLVSAILRQDPAPLPSKLSILPALDRIARRCLEKSPAERFQSARDLAFQLDSLVSNIESGSDAAVREIGPEHWRIPARVLSRIAIPAMILAAAVLAWWFRGWQLRTARPPEVAFERLTDFLGMEENPAISPDGKSVAFVSDSTGSRQIWIRLLAGGVPFQLTHDAGDHLSPRWSPDSASLFYYTPPADGSHEAVVWEISALGGTSRRLTGSLSEVDPSHDGKSLAFFRLGNGQIELVRTDRDASHPQVLAHFPPKTGCLQPRWSPDDSSIAFMLADDRWSDDLYYVSATGGVPRRVTFDAALFSGFSWLPGGSGFVFSTSRGSTLLYLPTLHLWQVSRHGGEPRQLTFGDESDAAPDVDSRGRLVSSRIRINFDIWKFPVAFAPAENVQRAVRVSHQTAQVQTPSLSPDGRQLVYLSDTGGHGNLWVLDLTSGQSRQITFEKDPTLIMGVPVWSPDGSRIAYARQFFGQGNNTVAYWAVRPDGSENNQFLARASWLTWSPDRRWVYYVDLGDRAGGSAGRILKTSTTDSTTTEVRNEVANGPAISADGSTLYYAKLLEPVNGLWDYEIRAAHPDSAPSRLLAPISGHRVPAWQGLHRVLSPDGKWLALTLNDTFGTNLWLLSTADGKMHPLTDFGERRTFIARRVAWSPDNKSIFAAVGEGDADIVFFDHLLR